MHASMGLFRLQKPKDTHPPPPPQRGQSAPIQTCCRSFTSGLKEAWGAKPISAALRDAERWARIHSKIPRGGLGCIPLLQHPSLHPHFSPHAGRAAVMEVNSGHGGSQQQPPALGHRCGCNG